MWSEAEFRNGLHDFHPQNRKSLARAAALIFQNAGHSFSRSLGNSFRQTVSGILAKSEMNTEEMLAGHISSTIDRCQACPGRIIVTQDTVFYNYTSHRKMEGLGAIKEAIKGTIQHNALAVNDRGVPLGLIYQYNWTRGGANAWEVESTKWFKGLDATNRHLGQLDKSVVLVQDREADIFAFFKADRAPNVDLIVRLYQPRRIETPEDQTVAYLAEAILRFPSLGSQQVSIRRANQEQDLTLSIQAAPTNVFPHKDLSPRLHKTQGLSMVVATEIAAKDKNGNDCFDPQNRAQWILLTSLEVNSLEKAAEVVRYYALRWVVERFHYTCKSGSLFVERLQFDDVTTIFNALAFYGIIAWRILFLTLSVREIPQHDPQAYFSPLEIKVLKTKDPNAAKSLDLAIKALGKLVNFVPTTKQPYPGIKIMTLALRKLHDVVQVLEQIDRDPLQD